MTAPEIATLAIAMLSLVISLWVVVRDRKQRQIDMLYKCYERLHQAHGARPFATASELAAMEDDPEDARWEEYKQKSSDAQSTVERELEFACYLVVKRQIDLEMFFYLFRGWLASRAMFWKHNEARAKNHPYTVQVIALCLEKKLLPIKRNEELQKLQAAVHTFLAD